MDSMSSDDDESHAELLDRANAVYDRLNTVGISNKSRAVSGGNQ